MSDIKFSYTYSGHNPNMNDASMDHWRCRLRNDGKSMTVYFSKGSGHNGAAPTLEEVLETLASDASGVDNARDFEDWCSEYGYDTDSRTAERTYNATPDPKWVVAVGACAVDGGIFAGTYAVAGGVSETIPVDLHIRGCPPTPTQLLSGLLALLQP